MGNSNINIICKQVVEDKLGVGNSNINVICMITYRPLGPHKCVKHQGQLSGHQIL